MREYNPETDKHLIIEAMKKDGEKTLASVARHFLNNGIKWPGRFNNDSRPHIIQLDKDISEVWNSHEKNKSY